LRLLLAGLLSQAGQFFRVSQFMSVHECARERKRASQGGERERETEESKTKRAESEREERQEHRARQKAREERRRESARESQTERERERERESKRLVHVCWSASAFEVDRERETGSAWLIFDESCIVEFPWGSIGLLAGVDF